MNKKLLVTISLSILLPSLAGARGINYKKIYCGNTEFIGNAANKRPHLHCGTNFLSYKKSNGDHTNLTDVGTCIRTDSVFDDIKANVNSFADYQTIYNALVAYHQAGCPNS